MTPLELPLVGGIWRGRPTFGATRVYPKRCSAEPPRRSGARVSRGGFRFQGGVSKTEITVSGGSEFSSRGLRAANRGEGAPNVWWFIAVELEKLSGVFFGETYLSIRQSTRYG